MAKKTSTNKPTTKKKRAAKRELIDTGTDKRFVRRGPGGKFKESDDVGKSLTADRRKQHVRPQRKPVDPGGHGLLILQ